MVTGRIEGEVSAKQSGFADRLGREGYAAGLEACGEGPPHREWCRKRSSSLFTDSSLHSQCVSVVIVMGLAFGAENCWNLVYVLPNDVSWPA